MKMKSRFAWALLGSSMLWGTNALGSSGGLDLESGMVDGDEWNEAAETRVDIDLSGNSPLRYFGDNTHNAAGFGGLARDSLGALYLVGTSASGVHPTDDQYGVLRKFDAKGRLLWESSSIGRIGEDFREIVIDSSDRIYITSTFSPTVRQLTTDGEVVWEVQIPPPPSVPSPGFLGYRIAPDGDGALFSVNHYNDYATDDGQCFEMFSSVIKLAGDGEVLWTRTLFTDGQAPCTPGAADGDIVFDSQVVRVRGSLPDGEGGAHVLGYASVAEGGVALFYLRLDADGAVTKFIPRLRTPLDDNQIIGDEKRLIPYWFISSPAGDMYAAGGSVYGPMLLKLSTEGEVEWLVTECDPQSECPASRSGYYYSPKAAEDGSIFLVETAHGDQHVEDSEGSWETEVFQWLFLVHRSADGQRLSRQEIAHRTSSLSAAWVYLSAADMALAGKNIWISGFESRQKTDAELDDGHDIFLMRCSTRNGTKSPRCPMTIK